MDDAQLREELTALGVNVGPINDGTRETYMRVLAKKKGASSPSRSSTRKSHSPARVSTSKNKTPPSIEKSLPISPSRRASPPPRRASPPPRRASPPPRRASPATRRASPPSTRRESPPPPVNRAQKPVSPRPYPRRASPPARQPPPPPKRVSPRPFAQSSSQYSRAADPITPDASYGRSTSAYNKIDFDNSLPDDEEDDDHMEFSKYIPRNNYSNRQKNTSLTSSFLNSTKKKIAAVHPPKGFQLNPTFLSGVAFTICVLAYLLYPDKVHDGINSSSDYVNSAIMAGFKYAIMPFLVLGVVFAIGCALYYGFQAHTKNKAIHEEKKRKMIKEILKAVYNAPAHGIAVKQLRDRMVPAYKRTKDELLLWNECEDFVKTYETRVRAEERASPRGDDILEYFVACSDNTALIQDLEDD